MTKAKKFEFDVFISHSSKDKQIARELANRLRADGLRVWFDEWEVSAGDLIGLKVEQGLELSRVLILCMSKSAFASDWVTLERHSVLYRDPTNSRRRFVPVRLDDAPINDSLRQFAYIDYRTRSEKEYYRLLEICRLPKSKKPKTRIPTLKSEVTTVPLGYAARNQRVFMDRECRIAVSRSQHGIIRVWRASSGEFLSTLDPNIPTVTCVEMNADSTRAISGSESGLIYLWQVDNGRCLATPGGHSATVTSMDVSKCFQFVLTGSNDRTVKLWNMKVCECLKTYEGHGSKISRVALDIDLNIVISGHHDGRIILWDLESAKIKADLIGHSERIKSITISHREQVLISGSSDGTIRVWSLDSGRCLKVLEGHTSQISHIVCAADGQQFLSTSHDASAQVWDIESGEVIGILKLSGDATIGATYRERSWSVYSANSSGILRELTLNRSATELTGAATPALSIYTNAKVVITGETGVGKTALASRITSNSFVPTISSDGSWATQLMLPKQQGASDAEREIWLWDFAGQLDYMFIHQLFMNETSLALFVFNPQSENPFEGLIQRDEALKRSARRSFAKILVAGRCDRGGLIISSSSMREFTDERGFAEYIETSAASGAGCDRLRDAIIANIPWGQIEERVSHKTFKILKDEIVKLREEERPLLRFTELKQAIEMRFPKETFTVEELRTAVTLLAGPGLIWKLDFGDFILLHPEYICSYASAVIRTVRAHKMELGCIAEDDVLTAKLDFQDMNRLEPTDEQVVLRAMHQSLIDYGICLRERTALGTQLVFPSHFRCERPQLSRHPAVAVIYEFSGSLDAIYASLIVKLHHTNVFIKDQLWKFAADFKSQGGKRLGLIMTKGPESTAKIEIYFEHGISEDTQVTFIRYVHDHLISRGNDVKRYRQYVCPHCGSPVENRNTVRRRLEKGDKDIVCVECERRIPLWDLIEVLFASESIKVRIRELEEKSEYEIDNESKELILMGHAYVIAGEAGQIYRQYTNSDHGIDGEIEFKDNAGMASGKKLYLQLKSGDSYLYHRKSDDLDVFTIKNDRHAQYWQNQAYPVMLVIRTSDGNIRWMDVSQYLQAHRIKSSVQIIFDGEKFDAAAIWRIRDKYFPLHHST